MGIIRNEKGQLVKGSASINPDGFNRARKLAKTLRKCLTPEVMDRTIKELIKLANSRKQTVLTKDGDLVEIEVDGDIEAIKEIMNRAYGKPTEHVEINTESRLMVTVRQMSDEELLRSFQQNLKIVEGKNASGSEATPELPA